MMDCEIGTSTAPNAPWKKRKMTIDARLQDNPHAPDMRMKLPTPM